MVRAIRNFTFVVALLPVSAAFAAPITTFGSGRPGYVCVITIELGTGGDDLRGGNDNVHGTMLLPFGATHALTWLSLDELRNSNSLNDTQNWPNWSTRRIDVRLPDCSTPSSSIHNLRLTTAYGGGVSGDNWNLQSIKVSWSGFAHFPGPSVPASGEFFHSYEPRREGTLVRFTGRDPFHQFDW
jgi:hypothetical protein